MVQEPHLGSGLRFAAAFQLTEHDRGASTNCVVVQFAVHDWDRIGAATQASGTEPLEREGGRPVLSRRVATAAVEESAPMAGSNSPASAPPATVCNEGTKSRPWMHSPYHAYCV